MNTKQIANQTNETNRQAEVIRVYDTKQAERLSRAYQMVAEMFPTASSLKLLQMAGGILKAIDESKPKQ